MGWLRRVGRRLALTARRAGFVELGRVLHGREEVRREKAREFGVEPRHVFLELGEREAPPVLIAARQRVLAPRAQPADVAERSVVRGRSLQHAQT